MTDRPIIFSAPMILALLAGRKTQTRRVLRLPKWASTDPGHIEFADTGEAEVICRDTGCLAALPLPYAVGDRLWVKENHYRTDDGDSEYAVCAVDADEVREHLATIDALPAWFDPNLRAAHKRLRPSIHMPRWASRLTLTVTEIRVERLNDISAADAIAEGVEPIVDHGVGNEQLHGIAYQQLWDRLHGDGAWLANPWVAAVAFDVHRANIDALDAGRDAA